MTSKLKLLLATTTVSAVMAGASPVHAAGTVAGTDINNNVSVSFQVGGVSQTAETASDSFKVDRKVSFAVEEKAAIGTTSVVPGATGTVTAFTVTNTSNDVLDFNLSLAQLSGGAAEHGGTDNLDVVITQICVDLNDNGTCDAGEETAGTSAVIDNLAADSSHTVWVYSDIPLSATNGQVAGLTLSATALDSSGAALVIANDGDTNTNAMETILADAGRDNLESAGDDYTVGAAALTVTKLSRIISDPVSSTNPKAIPGAVVEYCIKIDNGTGASTATGVAISDDISALNVTYDSSFGVKLNGNSESGGVCTAGTHNGDFTSGVVSGTLSDIAGGETRTLVFRVTID